MQELVLVNAILSLVQVIETMKNLSLYIHIPFCVRKCNYCDFLSAPCDDITKQEYVDALCGEIIERAESFREKPVDTIFFGGGTPSVLSGEQMEQIMGTVREYFQILPEAEISMEMNPGTVDKEKLESYKKTGINRISIGLQSANNEELKVLGRIHTWEGFLRTWEMVREAGFTNVNIDLMSALPGQTVESYSETLDKVLKLKPEHISAYSLIVEEGTLFDEWYGEDGERQDQLPDEATDRHMYEMTEQKLEENGYYRYEISNYALPGYECKHNIGYWKRKEYLGLGLGSASLLFKETTGGLCKNIRCSNVSDLNCYLNIGMEQDMFGEFIHDENMWTAEQTKLTKKDQMEEFMFLGLRMMEGVSSQEFEDQFGQSLQEVYGSKIEKLETQGLLEQKEESGRYALTKKGIDVSNQVFVEFLF